MASKDEYLQAIEESVNTAIACRAFLKAYVKKTPEMKRKINNTKYANVHNLALIAIEQDLLLCVTKVWDRAKDTLSLPNLVTENEWRGLRKSIIANLEKRIEAKIRLEAVVNCYTNSDQFRSLLVTRAEGFAHKVKVSFARERSKMADPKSASLGDIYLGLDIAIEALNLAALALDNAGYSKGQSGKQFQRISEQYLDFVPDLNNR